MPNLLRERDIPSLGRTGAAPEARPAEEIQGIPLSAGQAEGRVILLRSPEDVTRVRPGDVLVAPVLDTSWAALFPLAGAVVVEMGGTLSHGAIVAREYGLPGVINVPGVTRSLHDGDRVRVDADAGRVEVIERAP